MGGSQPTLVLASHNPGKRAELEILLAGLAVRLLSPEDLDLPEPEETGRSFEAIARAKAKLAANLSGHMAIADDTGLCVDQLDGRPGLRTKRWAQARGGWERARRSMAQRVGLLDNPKVIARASIACGMAWAEPQGACWSSFARVRGRLCWPESGEGPGFVRIFSADNGPFEVEGVLAHRRLAFEALVRKRG